MQLKWILKTLLEQSIIINLGIIITDADQALMNDIFAINPKPANNFAIGTLKELARLSTEKDSSSIEVEKAPSARLLCF